MAKTAEKPKTTGKPRKRLPLEVRVKALELYVEHGPSKASTLLAEDGVEVKPATISQWAKRSGVHAQRATRTAGATRARMADWQHSRTIVAEKWAEAAVQTLEQAKTAQSAGELRNLLTAAAIATDKSRLLEEESRGGPDGPDLRTIDAEIDALLRDLRGPDSGVGLLRELLGEGWRPPLGWTPARRTAEDGARSTGELAVWVALREDLAQWARDHDGFDELLAWAEGSVDESGPEAKKETVSGENESSRIDAEIEDLLGRMSALDEEKAALEAQADQLETAGAQIPNI